MDAIDVMVKTVVREHHFSPQIIDDLYLDDTDHFGLIYWYNDVKKVYEELKASQPTKK